MRKVAVRLFQFLVAFFFTTAVFVWYGGVSLLALALWLELAHLLGGSFLAGLIGGALAGGVVYWLARQPQIGEVFVQVGADLARMGFATVRRLEEGLASS